MQGWELKYVCENNTQRVRRGNKGWRSHTVRGRSKTNKEADGAGQNEAETPSSTRDRNRRSQSLALLQLVPLL